MVAFSEKLFVYRVELDKILDWVHGNPHLDREPILSLVSPPGTGKSWLMQATREKLHAEQLIVLSLNLPEYYVNKNLDIDKIKDWLRDDAYGLVRNFCAVPRFNRHAHITQSIEALVEAVALAQLRVLVVLDGYDEVPLEARRNLDAWIFLPFIRRSCVKILTGYRTGCRLEDGRLRQKEERIELAPPEKPQFGIDQFKLLYATKNKTPPSSAWVEHCRSWMRGLTKYHWDHPYINIFLFECAWQPGGALRSLKSQDLSACINAVVSPPGKGTHHIPLTHEEYEILQKITSQLDPTWLMSDYEKQFDVIPGHRYVDPLLGKGVVEYIRNTQRYRVAPGLYELLCEP